MEAEKAAQAAVAAEALSDKEGHGSDGSPLVSGSGREIHYGGWVYHLGVNTVGHEYCHLRYLVLRGTYVVMYKRDPEEHPGIKPIRKGAISHTLMVEEVGRRNISHGELYVLRFCNRLEQRKLGEIACASAGESHKWMEAFEQAKQQAEYNLLKGSTRQRFNMDGEFNLEGHRPRVRRYAKGLKKLIKIGKGPEMLIRQSSSLGSNTRRGAYFEGDMDVIEMHDWKCVRTVNGVRIFEDVSNSKDAKSLLLKSVSIIEANADTVFEVVLSLDRHKRYEWDSLTGDLELLDSVNGHYDVVYGTYEPTRLNWWHSKRDFVFSRQWFRGQDGSYTILQLPAPDKRRPPKSGYRRMKINPSTWEIRRLKTSNFSTEKCLVTHMLEVQYYSWGRWWRNQFSNFDKTIPYALLCQVTGLKEYFGANPSLTIDTSLTIVEPKVSDASTSETEFKDSEMADEFFDATAGSDSLDDEDSDDEIEIPKGDGNLKLKNVSWAILALRRNKGLLERSELDANCPSVSIDPSQFHGSMVQGKAQTDTNCWNSPNGHGFMIRGKNYLKDCSKIVGGDPLLKLIAVDWFKANNNSIDKVALHPKSLVQSKAGKALPFILIVNLEIPSKPNYSLVLYYAAEKPLSKDSLLGRFVDGTDMFRDSRFKLIPSIVEGYWMVKRAVGTKACLLGKAVTCKYLRQDNFLEIDVEIGSSSVARSIISLVIGYITSIVVDLAILIEAKEENELPEYILGTVRLNQVRLESAVPYWGEY